MAPEIIECKIYSGLKADVFALGVVLFYMVIGKFPFNEATLADENYRLIIQEKFAHFWINNHGTAKSQEFKHLIMSMICYDPEKRATIEDISNHIWTRADVNLGEARRGLYEAFGSSNYY